MSLFPICTRVIDTAVCNAQLNVHLIILVQDLYQHLELMNPHSFVNFLDKACWKIASDFLFSFIVVFIEGLLRVP